MCKKSQRQCRKSHRQCKRRVMDGIFHFLKEWLMEDLRFFLFFIESYKHGCDVDLMREGG